MSTTSPSPAAAPAPPADPLAAAAAWLRDGHACALATVMRTWGSSPRPVGSKLAVRDDGAMVGSVSGGCVEGAVVDAAVRAIAAGADAAPETLVFGVADETAWEVGLACGGTIEILVEAIT